MRLQPNIMLYMRFGQILDRKLCYLDQNLLHVIQKLQDFDQSLGDFEHNLRYLDQNLKFGKNVRDFDQTFPDDLRASGGRDLPTYLPPSR